MKYNKFFIFLIFLIFSCNTKGNKQNKRKIAPEKKDVILIFNKIPENWKLNFKRGYTSHGKYEVSYTKSGFNNYFWLPDYKHNIDALVIKDVMGSIELIHKYRGLDKFNYLFNAGDTIAFTYDSLIPIADVINRKTKKYDGNYEVLKRKQITNNDFPAYIKCHSVRNFFVAEKDRYIFDKKLDSIFKKEQKAKAKKELKQEHNLLDSLFTNKLISKSNYDFYTNRIYYHTKVLNADKNISNVVKQKNDTMLKYSFYRSYLNFVVKNTFEKNVKMLQSSNGSSPDYRIVFDSINSSSLFGAYEKKYLLFTYMENIINTFPNSDINKYFAIYKNKKDSLRINYLAKTYNLTGSISNEIQLLDKAKHKITLKDILHKNKGKVIYIDFWASWCAPCRATMPASKKLKSFYKNKDVVFVYLALNDRFNAWQEAAKKEGLENFENNYFIVNSKSSKLIENLEINAIPRYLIYNKKGELVHKNAPRPNSKELKNLLNKYLLKKN